MDDIHKKKEGLLNLSDEEIFSKLLQGDRPIKNLILFSLIAKDRKLYDIFDFLLTKGQYIGQINLSPQKIYNFIFRRDRNEGLIQEGMVEIISEEEKIYRVTNKGIEYLSSLCFLLEKNNKDFESTEIIQKISSFFEKRYNAQMLEGIRTKRNFILINFQDIMLDEPEIAEQLLDNPSDIFEYMGVVVRNRYQVDESKKPFMFRVKNLPKNSEYIVREIRNELLNKLISIRGIVRQKSNVIIKVTESKWECPSCGNVINIINREILFKEPKLCGCGRKGNFKLLDKKVIDYQEMELEELPECSGYEQPRRLRIILKGDLTSPLTDNRTNPGMPVKVTGILKSDFVEKKGKKTTIQHYYYNVSNIEPLEDRTVTLSESDIKEIKKLNEEGQIIDRLISSFSPSIRGMKQIKYAILLSIVGGCKKKKEDITILGLINLLIIGDPGKAKSQLLIRGNELSLKGKYLTGQSTSGPGLGATVVKSKLLDDMWTVESGVLPMCNGGQCWIDEISRMDEKDRNWLYEAMALGQISVHKASIHTTLKSETSVIAGGNPIYDRFSCNEILARQLGIPPALINRFDVIFPIVDRPDKIRDKEIAQHILSLHRNEGKELNPITTPLLRKYLSYASELQPTFTKESSNIIEDYYVTLRNSQMSTLEGGNSPIPCNERQLQALIRLTEANAKLRLAFETDANDARSAIELIDTQLRLLGLDPMTGKIDIDRISASVSNYERNMNEKIREIIMSLINEKGKLITIEDIIQRCKEKLGVGEEELDKRITYLKKMGDIFEVKKGQYSIG